MGKEMLRAGSLIAASVVTLVARAAPVERPADDAGTIYLGAVAGQDWGRPLAAGDLDGDGYDEVIVGASESWGGTLSRVYVLRGGPGAHARGVLDLSAGGSDQVILGATVDDNLGASIAAGDVNGDAVDDLLICASTADFDGIADRGIAYVIFGGPSFFDLATRDLSDDANWDLRILGPVAAGDMGGANLFGGLDAHAVAVGRVNDDLWGDIILGVHLASGGGSQSGSVYVVFGEPFASGLTLNLATAGDYDVRIDGESSYDELGTVVLAADLTGDGIDELILPNEYASQGLFTSEGAVHVFRGRANWPSFISLAAGPAEITLLGAREDDGLGAAAAVGDFNHDDIPDLAAAAPGADAGAHNDQRGDGFVYGLLGATTYQTGVHTIDYATATPDFFLIGEFEENLGAEVSAGDFNGDGFVDIAAAERFAGPQTNGVVEVLLGRMFPAGAAFTAHVDTDLRILGAPQDRIGFSLAASDVNGDGLAEILFGTPFNNGNSGTVYVFTHAGGDSDHDGDHDLVDFARFQACFTGPTGPLPIGACALFDFDLDEDVDFSDFAEYMSLLLGPGL
jgi:hypothetical protein